MSLDAPRDAISTCRCRVRQALASKARQEGMAIGTVTTKPCRHRLVLADIVRLPSLSLLRKAAPLGSRLLVAAEGWEITPIRSSYAICRLVGLPK